MLRIESAVFYSVILSLGAVSTALHSYSDDMRLRNFENRLTALEDRREVCCMFNPSARLFASNCFGVYLEATALYWTGYLGFPSFGVVTDPASTKPPITWGPGDKRVLMLDPLSGWGFECKLGCNLAYDSWDLSLSWTRWHPEGKVSPKNSDNVLLAPSGLLDPAVLDSTKFLSDASYQANAQVCFDWIRWENGRQFYFSPQFIARPYTGFSMLWLHDIELRSEYNGNKPSDGKTPLTAEFNHKIHFSGMGVRMGNSLQWNIGCDISFISSLAYGLHYGEFKLTQRSWVNPAMEKLTSAKYKAVQDTVDFSSAIQWSWQWGCSNESTTSIVFEAGWNGVLAPGMNQDWTWCNKDYPGYVVQGSSPVFLSGWFFSGRVDF